MTHVSSCGHILHSECWIKFYNIVKEKLVPTLIPRRRSCIDITLSEYLCPLCNSLCNTVLPLLPKVQEEKSEEVHDMGINEFMSYLERFSAELSSLVPRKVEKEAAKNRGPGFFSLGIRFLQSYIGNNEMEANENVMEMFAKKLLQINSSNDDRQSIPLSWLSCSFTVQALECVHREMKTNMFEEVSDRQMMFLYGLVQYLSSSSIVGVYEPIQEYGSQIFNFFCGDDDSLPFSIASADIFGIMVSLRFLVSAVGNIFQEKTPNFLKISHCLVNDVVFKICLIAHYVKTLIQTPPSHPEDRSDEGAEYLIDSWKYVKQLIGTPTKSSIHGQRLKEAVMASLLPFLRCSAMFFHLLTGVNLPEELKSKSLNESIEMSCLLKYLNLPVNLEEILSLDNLKNDRVIINMIDRWCHDLRGGDETKTETTFRLIQMGECYLSSRRIIALPEQYSALVKKASGFKCPTVGDTSRSPSLCLICGEMVCSQCYCCVTEKNLNQRYGASANHINECGKGVGMFLRIRDCEVYLLYSQRKGVFMAAPYLDKYGEPDRGFRRGNPLFLDKERYERLQNMWLEHKIPTMIAQAMENNRTLLTYDWNLI